MPDPARLHRRQDEYIQVNIHHYPAYFGAFQCSSYSVDVRGRVTDFRSASTTGSFYGNGYDFLSIRPEPSIYYTLVCKMTPYSKILSVSYEEE